MIHVWLQVVLITVCTVIAVIPVALTHALRRGLDWIMRPAAKRIPQPGDIVVLIGASTGIGESAARHLLGRGFRIFAGVRNKADSDRLQRLGMEPLILDVTKPDQIAAAVQAIPDHAVLGAVICNAGISTAGPLEVTPLEKIRGMIDVNLTGVMMCARAFLPRLRRDRGRLIVTGSICGFVPGGGGAPYTATKFAIRGLVLALAQELRPVGVSVSVVEPGATVTPILSKVHDTLVKVPEGSPYTGLVRFVEEFMGKFQDGAERAETTTDVAIYKAVTDRRPAMEYLPSCTATFYELLSQFPNEFWNLIPTLYRASNGLQAW